MIKRAQLTICYASGKLKMNKKTLAWTAVIRSINDDGND